MSSAVADRSSRANTFARQAFGWTKSGTKRCFKARMVRVNGAVVEETRQLVDGDVVSVVHFTAAGEDEEGAAASNSAADGADVPDMVVVAAADPSM